MFGKKKEPKGKEPSPMEITVGRIIGEVEQLAPGQSLVYKLPEFYWSGFAAFLIAELNPSYPEKGRKYIMSTDRIADGKPVGKKAKCFESNDPKSYADWVAQKNWQSVYAERFNGTS